MLNLVEQILHVVDNDTSAITELVICYNNTWEGYLPLEPGHIDLNLLQHFHNLTTFKLLPLYSDKFEQFPIVANATTLIDLQTLQTLQIHLPISDNTFQLVDVINGLNRLEVLDLSNTRGLGLNYVTRLIQSLSDSNSTVQHLCLCRVQLIGSLTYKSTLSTENSTLSLPNVIELDLSSNAIGLIYPVLQNLTPNISKLDVSDNILVNILNAGFLIDALFHHKIEILNVGKQGNVVRDYSDDKTSSSCEDSSLSTGNSLQLDYLTIRQYQLIVQCMNKVALQIGVSIIANVSELANNTEAVCYLMKCMIPSYFSILPCRNTFKITLKDIISLECAVHVNLPIGENLHTVYMSQMHFEMSNIIGLIVHGPLCLGKNKVGHVEFDNNKKWIHNFDRSLSFTRSAQNLNTMEYFSFAYNGFCLNQWIFLTNFTNLTVLDISGNYFYKQLNQSLCLNSPHLTNVSFNHMQLNEINSDLLINCSKMQSVSLDNNQITSESLNNLRFEGLHNLNSFSIANNNISYLGEHFRSAVDKSSQIIKINLHENPLICNCSSESRSFIKWMLGKNKEKNHTMFPNFEKYYCHVMFEKNETPGFIFINMINEASFWEPCDKTRILIETVIITVIGTMFFTCIFIAVIKFRFRIRYWIFRFQVYCGMLLTAMCRNKTVSRRIWKYDAFISYCKHDRRWVHDTLMNYLEQTHGFRLCIHLRDFPVGDSIIDVIPQKMQESREIIIVLSDLALRSEWCHFELQHAVMQSNRMNKNLIVIRLELNDAQVLDYTVAHILSNYTYLEWAEKAALQKTFWAKLVGRLYNDPDGCSFCCPYGADSLGYRNISDTMEENEDSEGTSVMSPQQQTLSKQAKKSKEDIAKAEHFMCTLQGVLDSDNLPHWAYGPTPGPIHELLKDHHHEFDVKVNRYAKERVAMMIRGLHEFKHKEILRLNQCLEKLKQN